MRSFWVSKVSDFLPDGAGIVSVIIETDEGPILLRGKRSTAIAGTAMLARGLTKIPRIAEVVPMRRAKPVPKH